MEKELNFKWHRVWKKLYVVENNEDYLFLENHIRNDLGIKLKIEPEKKKANLFVPLDNYDIALQNSQILLLHSNPTGIIRWVDKSKEGIERDYDTISIGVIKTKNKALDVSNFLEAIGDKAIKIYPIPEKTHYLVDYKLDDKAKESSENYQTLVNNITKTLRSSIIENIDIDPSIDSYYDTYYDGHINKDSMVKTKIIKE